MAVPKLYYFGLAGRGEFPKLVLEEAGQHYEWVKVGFGEQKAHPLADKLPYGQLPLWEETDGFSLVQTGTIVRYLAKKYGLYPTDLHEAAKAELVYEGAADYTGSFFQAHFGDDKAKEHHIKDVLPKWFASFEKLLAGNHEGKGFFVGDKITFADLAIYQAVAFGSNLAPTAIKSFPHLSGFIERITARPNIAAYLKSDRCPH